MKQILLSPKFISIAKEAIKFRIKSMRVLLDDETSTDEQLAEIDYGNDIWILEMVLTELNNADKRDKNGIEFSSDFLIYHQALNEVCNGSYAIDEEEFHTLMGATKPEAENLLARGNDFWKNGFVLTQDEDGLSLQKLGSALPDNHKTLFTFFAKDYNEAMAIRNKFMDWEMYIPMPEHIAVRRTLTLFDENKQPIADVKVFFYQPQEILENDSRCEFHINIEHKNPTKQGWKTKTENLGGKQAIGVDSTQALLLAMRLAEMLIEGYNNDNKNKIYWLEYGQKAVLLDLGTFKID